MGVGVKVFGLKVLGVKVLGMKVFRVKITPWNWIPLSLEMTALELKFPLAANTQNVDITVKSP